MQRPIETPVGDNVTSTPKGTSAKPHTIWFWLALAVVFVGWGWVQHRHEKVNKELEPSNILANLHNLAVITFAAVIGIVGGKVLFTKLAAVSANVPFMGRAFAYIAQLFAAA